MKIKSQTLTLELFDSIELVMPNGEIINIGYGDENFPEQKTWIITEVNSNERGFKVKSDGKLKEYELL